MGPMRSISLLFIAALVAACATAVRLEKFETMARAYERALRWSDFRTAFALAGNADAQAPDFSRLQDVRVTSYDVIGAPQRNDEASEVVQMVEIRYANLGNMSERRLMDRQTWIYSPSAERWKLRSPFPAFP